MSFSSRSTSSSIEPPLMSPKTLQLDGYLYKLGRKGLNWKKYWFTLAGSGYLHYYRDKGDDPAGFINLQTAKTVRKNRGGKGFLIEISTPNRQYVLTTPDQEVCDKWLRALYDALLIRDGKERIFDNSFQSLASEEEFGSVGYLYSPGGSATLRPTRNSEQNRNYQIQYSPGAGSHNTNLQLYHTAPRVIRPRPPPTLRGDTDDAGYVTSHGSFIAPAVDHFNNRLSADSEEGNLLDLATALHQTDPSIGEEKFLVNSALSPDSLQVNIEHNGHFEATTSPPITPNSADSAEGGAGDLYDDRLLKHISDLSRRESGKRGTPVRKMSYAEQYRSKLARTRCEQNDSQTSSRLYDSSIIDDSFVNSNYSEGESVFLQQSTSNLDSQTQYYSQKPESMGNVPEKLERLSSELSSKTDSGHSSGDVATPPTQASSNHYSKDFNTTIPVDKESQWREAMEKVEVLIKETENDMLPAHLTDSESESENSNTLSHSKKSMQPHLSQSSPKPKMQVPEIEIECDDDSLEQSVLDNAVRRLSVNVNPLRNSGDDEAVLLAQSHLERRASNIFLSLEPISNRWIVQENLTDVHHTQTESEPEKCENKVKFEQPSYSEAFRQLRSNQPCKDDYNPIFDANNPWNPNKIPFPPISVGIDDLKRYYCAASTSHLKS